MGELNPVLKVPVLLRQSPSLSAGASAECGLFHLGVWVTGAFNAEKFFIAHDGLSLLNLCHPGMQHHEMWGTSYTAEETLISWTPACPVLGWPLSRWGYLLKMAKNKPSKPRVPGQAPAPSAQWGQALCDVPLPAQLHTGHG